MRSLKIWASSLALVLFLVSCTSTKVSTIVIPSGSEIAVKATEKKAAFTESEKKNWQHLDLEKDSIPGMSVDRAYEFLGDKKGKEVLVAVVDSGTDLKHEDLKDNAWVNPKEIPGNGKDDDKNGYVDDVNGWNFLGKIYKENAELYRIIKDTTIVDSETLKRAKKEYDTNFKKAKGENTNFQSILLASQFADRVIKDKLKVSAYKKSDISKLDKSNQQEYQAVQIANYLYDVVGVSSIQEAIDELTKLIEGNKDLLSGAVLKQDFRSVLKDDENSMTNKFYGDNTTGPAKKEEAHGSHVSGIIGAYRFNKKGMKGVANNVKIMAVRVVPDGDEYDKDVALGIRYAVDNGAKVINTSFGKSYSPKSAWVYEAIKYAADKDVLIVNAAGNDSKDIDTNLTFPNDTPDGKIEIADNFITIGAIDAKYNENLPATFTNYGKQNVDIFAPGVKIYSTTPENEYAFKNGTSMASPAVAGVAALIRSYYPEFTAAQVKRILMNSGSKIDLQVIKPGSQSQENQQGVKVAFSELSVTGRIVNAYNALKMADALSK